MDSIVRKLVLSVVTMLLSACIYCIPKSLAQSDVNRIDPSVLSVEKAAGLFARARTLSESDNGRLWGFKLYGPMLFVDPTSRTYISNENLAGMDSPAEKAGEVFIGKLNNSQVAANTRIDLNGRAVAMVCCPLPEYEVQSSCLMMHELFHCLQGRLRAEELNGSENSHLNSLEGRYYMQLEWRALAWALQSSSDQELRSSVRDALVFRARRYELIPKASSEEKSLELDEGLAEYTGIKLASTDYRSQLKLMMADFDGHTKDATFVRSFAYCTGPAYGLLLDKLECLDWRKQIMEDRTSSLPALLTNWLAIDLPSHLNEAAEKASTKYSGTELFAAEQERQHKLESILQSYREKFALETSLKIPLTGSKSFSFDPRNLLPLDALGNVYPTIEVTAEFGKLKVASGGALLNEKREQIVISEPVTVSGSNILGEGWQLQLNPGWEILRGAVVQTGTSVITAGGAARTDGDPARNNEPVDWGPYLSDVQRRIKRAWSPPEGVESRRVTVSFQVALDGKASNIRVTGPSDSDEANDAAIKAVELASPFRPLPTGCQKAANLQYCFDSNASNSRVKVNRD